MAGALRRPNWPIVSFAKLVAWFISIINIMFMYWAFSFSLSMWHTTFSAESPSPRTLSCLKCCPCKSLFWPFVCCSSKFFFNMRIALMKGDAREVVITCNDAKMLFRGALEGMGYKKNEKAKSYIVLDLTDPSLVVLFYENFQHWLSARVVIIEFMCCICFCIMHMHYGIPRFSSLPVCLL